MENNPSLKFKLTNLSMLIWVMFLVFGALLNAIYITTVLSPGFYSDSIIYQVGNLLASFGTFITLYVHFFTLFAIVGVIIDFLITNYFLITSGIVIGGFHGRYLVTFALLTFDSVEPTQWFLGNFLILSFLVVLNIWVEHKQKDPEQQTD